MQLEIQPDKEKGTMIRGNINESTNMVQKNISTSTMTQIEGQTESVDQLRLQGTAPSRKRSGKQILTIHQLVYFWGLKK